MGVECYMSIFPRRIWVLGCAFLGDRDSYASSLIIKMVLHVMAAHSVYMEERKAEKNGGIRTFLMASG